MTAEQFIKSHFKGIEKETWFPAMVVFSEEYAEQQAIEFAYWIMSSLERIEDSDGHEYTMEEIYKQFKEEQK